MASASYTLSIMASAETTQSVFDMLSLRCIFGSCPHHALVVQHAYLHTLRSFEALNHDLTHLNAETERSLARLDSHIDILRDLLSEEVDGLTKEIGELLGRLWTRLGGNRSSLSDAHERQLSLSRAGEKLGLMRRVVWDAQVELHGLQQGTDALRAYTVEPLLVDGPLPRREIIRALIEGCETLQEWNVRRIPLMPHKRLPSRLDELQTDITQFNDWVAHL